MTHPAAVRTAALLIATLALACAGPAARAADADPTAGPGPVAAASSDPSVAADDAGTQADAASEAAREADRRAEEAREHQERVAAATISATAPGLSTGTLRPTMASAEVFRPAPLPDEAASGPARTVAAADDGATLHPDFFHMSEKTSGALPTTSSEYEHSSRVGPAGGMSLSIPMD